MKDKAIGVKRCKDWNCRKYNNLLSVFMKFEYEWFYFQSKSFNDYISDLKNTGLITNYSLAVRTESFVFFRIQF